MKFITHPTPKANKNDEKILKEIELLRNKDIGPVYSPNQRESLFNEFKIQTNKLTEQLSMGYWCEKYLIENGKINLDHVIFIEKYTSTQDDIIGIKIPCIRFDTVKGVQFLYFQSERVRDIFYNCLDLETESKPNIFYPTIGEGFEEITNKNEILKEHDLFFDKNNGLWCPIGYLIGRRVSEFTLTFKRKIEDAS